MIFDTGEMKGFVDTTPLFRTPLIRAAGITLRLFARTSVEMPTVNVFIASGLGRAITATDLPVVERQYLYDSVISIVSSMCSESSDEMSNIERDIDYSYKINIGNTLSRISQDYIADCAKKLDMPSTSITETTINEITQ